MAAQNSRKGSGILEEALRILGPRDDVVLLVAGVGAGDWVGKVPISVQPLGYLSDDRLIAMANAAADLVVVPSVVENLPNSVIEAFACARPVVAFDAGGMRDAVRHQETGLLIPPNDAAAFAEALTSMLGDAAGRRAMGECGLQLARLEYSTTVQGERFEALYLDLLERAKIRGADH